MDELLTYLQNLALTGGIWLVVLSAVGFIAVVGSWFLFIVALRSGLWLWDRLPLWEAQNHRQAMMERGVWKDDEAGSRFLLFAERQRRKWGYLLNGIFTELGVLVIGTVLLMAGQPAGWFVLAIGSVLVGLFVLTAWI